MTIFGKTFREKLLNLCGYEIWPPTHNDPRIKGPQPRIITKRQADALREMSRASGESESCCVKQGSDAETRDELPGCHESR